MDSFERGQPEPIAYPQELLWEIEFGFDSRLPIEECINQLFSIDNSSKRFAKRRKKVNIYQLEDNIIHCQIYVPRPPMSAWLVTQLEQTDTDVISVHGKIGIVPLPVYGVLIFAGCLSLPFLAIPPVGCIWSPIFFGSMFYTIRNDGIETRDELKNIVEEKLSS